MIINRYNYQEYFLLYIDDELNSAERVAVESFVQQNPDLTQELVEFQQSVFKPDEQIIFENKEILFQFENKENLIHPDNFAEFAISYSDNELSGTERQQLENFILENPHYQQELDLIQNLKLSVDESIRFPNKEVLYRHEKQSQPFIFPWWHMAAAAMILLSTGLLWLNESQSGKGFKQVAQGIKTTPAKQSDKAIIKKPETNNIDKVANHPENIGEPSNTQINTSLAISDKKIKEKTKKEILRSKSSDKINPVKENLNRPGEGGSQNSVAVNSNDIEIPKAVQVDNKPSVKRNAETDNLAAIEASIEKNNKRIKEQSVLRTNTINNDNYNIAKTVANTETEDDGALLTDKKNPLRGILRKASRFIDKNTSFRTPKKSGLLIGNVEIAFQ